MTGRITVMGAFAAVAALGTFQGCGEAPRGDAPIGRTVRLATTTSTENTGLLDVLLPPFEKRFACKVHVIAVGTGRALALGRSRDVDAVLVHAPAAEMEFVGEGHGVNRRSVMYNDFVLLGPPADPARLAEATGAADALGRIARSRATFVSRGDDSGTHKKEKLLWQKVGMSPTPKGDWYLEAGQGMGATLLMADEKEAYCLCDRGTFLAFEAKIGLRVLLDGDDELLNRYSIIAVNPDRHHNVNYLGAMTLIAWVTSPEGQRIIGDSRVGGKTLFHPLAVPEAAEKAEAAHTE